MVGAVVETGCLYVCGFVWVCIMWSIVAQVSARCCSGRCSAGRRDWMASVGLKHCMMPWGTWDRMAVVCRCDTQGVPSDLLVCAVWWFCRGAVALHCEGAWCNVGCVERVCPVVGTLGAAWGMLA